MKRPDALRGEIEQRVIGSNAPGRTVEVGRRIGESIPAGTVISLAGGLGAGKTLLARGICIGLGISEEVLSPSFILVEEYEGDYPALHFDLYRLKTFREVEEVGLFDAVDGRNIVMVEWGDRLPDGIAVFDVSITIKITGELDRRISIEAPVSLLDAIEGNDR
jgi:tRNA threonylcarbamoyladenosine biosynthesis protein TsaE